ncbi:MAG: hypothetical protein NZ761_00610 [Dehalococcoidia bacterium]|nr:hypothetical protein [Dehalococcoidia bacterium]
MSPIVGDRMEALAAQLWLFGIPLAGWLATAEGFLLLFPGGVEKLVPRSTFGEPPAALAYRLAQDLRRSWRGVRNTPVAVSERELAWWRFLRHAVVKGALVP